MQADANVNGKWAERGVVFLQGFICMRYERKVFRKSYVKRGGLPSGWSIANSSTVLMLA